MPDPAGPQPADRPRRRYPPDTLIGIAILGVLGTALWLQPLRWTRTPAYGILIHVASVQVWGTVYLLAALGLIAALAIPLRALTVIAHTFATILLLIWAFAFIVRYVSDSATTIVNVVSWTSYLFIVMRSATTCVSAHHPAIDQKVPPR